MGLGDKREKGYLKAEPIEIIYDKKKEEFRVTKGVVDLGYMGIYPYHLMEVYFDKEEFFEEYEGDDRSWREINKDMTEVEIAKSLTRYCNERIENLYRNLNELNNCFLAYLFQDMLDVDYHFWEQEEGTPPFLITEKMPKVSEEDLEDAIFTQEVRQRIAQGIGAYYDTPNNGTVKKVDFEQLVRDCFPMIDLSKLTANIYGEYLYIDLEEVTFQCNSDDCDFGIVCGAYAVIQKDNSFFDWHNF